MFGKFFKTHSLKTRIGILKMRKNLRFPFKIRGSIIHTNLIISEKILSSLQRFTLVFQEGARKATFPQRLKLNPWNLSKRGLCRNTKTLSHIQSGYSCSEHLVQAPNLEQLVLSCSAKTAQNARATFNFSCCGKVTSLFPSYETKLNLYWLENVFSLIIKFACIVLHNFGGAV